MEVGLQWYGDVVLRIKGDKMKFCGSVAALNNTKENEIKLKK